MKSKVPNKKIWKFEISYNPAPTRDNIIIHYLIIELCMNMVKYYTQFEDSNKFEVNENFVKNKYPEYYNKFLNEWTLINRIKNKKYLNNIN